MFCTYADVVRVRNSAYFNRGSDSIMAGYCIMMDDRGETVFGDDTTWRTLYIGV